jgi:hypothetical protein
MTLPARTIEERAHVAIEIDAQVLRTGACAGGPGRDDQDTKMPGSHGGIVIEVRGI